MRRITINRCASQSVSSLENGCHFLKRRYVLRIGGDGNCPNILTGYVNSCQIFECCWTAAIEERHLNNNLAAVVGVAVLATQNQILEQQMADVASSLMKAQTLELQVADIASSLKKAQTSRWTCWAAIGPLLACQRT